MFYTIKKIILISGFSMATFVCTGQQIDQKSLSKNYLNITRSEALEDIGKEFGLKIFYQTKAALDQRGEWRLIDAKIVAWLNTLLDGSGLDFMIYRNQAIIIANASLINQQYTANFYKVLENRLNSLDAPEIPNEHEIELGDIREIKGNASIQFAGTITDEETGEPLIGATILIEELKRGSSTDLNGVFQLELPIGQYHLTVNSVGYDVFEASLAVFSEDSLNLRLQKEAITLDEVIIQSRAVDQNVRQVVSGVEQLSAQTIKELPTFMGEADVVKSLLFMPGVSTIGEGSGGFNVRGGTVDQNLFLQDESFIFNTSHALGFFSTFNADLISGATLYKGTMPAQYGGRLASVLDVRMRDGSYEEMKIRGGLGVVSSRLSIEAPIVKEQSSFLIGGRMTYSDWVLGLIDVRDIQESSNSFYDFNGRLTQNFGDKAKLVVSGYLSKDKLTFSDQFGFDYDTKSVQLNLQNAFKSKWLSTFSAVYSTYESDLLNLNSNDDFRLTTGIKYFKLKEVLKYTFNESSSLEFGTSYIDYELNPGSINPLSDNSIVNTKTLDSKFAREFNAFVDYEWNIGSILSLTTGLRATRFENVGPAEVNEYVDNEFPSNAGYIESKQIANEEIIANYQTLEPRISARLFITAQSSIKLGYGRTSQFLHQISNTAAATPVDIWQVSNKFLRPQSADNFSLGYFRNWLNNAVETSLELYYRNIDNLVEYKDFADLLANERLETELLRGKGRTYGAELSVKKRLGMLTGWFSYTYSRSERKVAGNSREFTINNGKWYPSNYDKPHDFSLVTEIALNKRHSILVNVVYSSGRPTSGPIGKFSVGNARNIPIYSDRNALRIPDYHRLDVAYNLSAGLRKNKQWKGSWTFSIYNVLGRQNAYSVFYTQPPFGTVMAKKFSILGSAFPAITYNFEIK